MSYDDKTFGPDPVKWQEVEVPDSYDGPKLEKIVVLCTAENLPDTALDAVVYEDFIGAFDGEMEWPEFDENAASSLCYTSGTTGNP